jgi:8-oxo-dGTP pyrophosphatase MutT (NUDIX family)
MYKVFFNDSTISIVSEMKKSLNDDASEVFRLSNYDSISQLIDRIENSKYPLHFYVPANECSETWDYFRSYFTEIPAAGGLVKNLSGRLLFIKRLGYWDLPKGKIEPFETPEEAAVREVEEECGIDGLKVTGQLDSTFHIYRSPFLPDYKNLVLKETKWFLMEYAGNQLPVPQIEEDIVDIKWFSSEELSQFYENTYSSLRRFIESSLSVI